MAIGSLENMSQFSKTYMSPVLYTNRWYKRICCHLSGTSAFFCELCLKYRCPRHFKIFHFNCFPCLVNLSPKLCAYLVQPNERFHWLFEFVNNWFTIIFIPSLYKMSPFHFNFRNEFLNVILLLIVTGRNL